jgi:hypothetical protein
MRIDRNLTRAMQRENRRAYYRQLIAHQPSPCEVYSCEFEGICRTEDMACQMFRNYVSSPRGKIRSRDERIPEKHYYDEIYVLDDLLHGRPPKLHW